ncbi:hypothetical protein THAOC_13148 [Thalassiosira oceanica]|uniref:Uncharacterized protein n=1 Tax=Thalassiosira oceanica TaxID=159749 RepID=K0SLU5_THAOC|nr:hypothetical protein THAOC_13148 [Thalassiosira oceanica]|eukprot:EJK65954.1 hypothetical protein THAOC_13148 [Thalassiosira oceanica]
MESACHTTSAALQLHLAAAGDDGRQLTLALNRWRRGVLPGLTAAGAEDALAMASPAASSQQKPDGNDTDGRDPAATASTVPAVLVSILEDGSSTEGQRESSLEILNELLRIALGSPHDAARGHDNNGGRKASATSTTTAAVRDVLPGLFDRVAETFSRRMARSEAVGGCGAGGRGLRSGSGSGPSEPSEHIRLGLVILATDLCGYMSRCGGPGEKRFLRPASLVCRTLATSALLDPYPDVQRESCALIHALSLLCPTAVRMNATSLLVPFTGRADGGGRGAAARNKCLFRHRHAKTRAKAVSASAAIVLCCPRSSSGGCVADVGDASAAAATVDPEGSAFVSTRGSKSSSIEQVLHDALLPSWESLMTTDSATVQIEVLRAVGRFSSYSDRCVSSDREMPIHAAVETRALSLLLSGLSTGRAAQVRSTALQILRGQRTDAEKRLTGGGGLDFPKERFAAYFKSTLELSIEECSRDRLTFQASVCSLETLQVVLCIAISSIGGGALSLSEGDGEAILQALVMSSQHEDREVLEAAMSTCCVIGGGNQSSIALLSAVPFGELSQELEGVEVPELTPRQKTSLLLIVDGLMKGQLDNTDALSILKGVDEAITLPDCDWFASTSAQRIISSLFCAAHDRVATNATLAWALLDACDSFVKCVGRYNQCNKESLGLDDRVMVQVLTCIVFLLSCPDDFGTAPKMLRILQVFTATQTIASDEGTLLDVHFRSVAENILVNTSRSFPWKPRDPSFLALDALLRACRGSTTGSNFDLLAPFFIGHLTALGGEPKRDIDADEYSLRIALMSLLQTILSDGSFFQNSAPIGQRDTVADAFKSDLTTDVILSLVIPNMVWSSGGMSAALRKLSIATLFSLLSRYGKVHRQNEGDCASLKLETVAHLIPILHSNLDDGDATTRELTCVCLAFTLVQTTPAMMVTISEDNSKVLGNLQSRLTDMLDDSSNPVRIAACGALDELLELAHSTSKLSTYGLGAGALRDTCKTLLVHESDSDHPDVQSKVAVTLAKLLSRYQDNVDVRCNDIQKPNPFSMRN